MDVDEENLEELWNKHRKGDHSAKGRRARELKPIAYADRRALISQPTKSAQLNLKVTPVFKATVVSLALKERQSMAEFIERIVTQYMETL